MPRGLPRRKEPRMDCRAEGEGSPSVTGSIDGEACLLFSLFSSLLSQLLLSSWKRARWLSWTANRRSSKLRQCLGGLAPSAAFGSRSSLANFPHLLRLSVLQLAPLALPQPSVARQDLCIRVAAGSVSYHGFIACARTLRFPTLSIYMPPPRAHK